MRQKEKKERKLTEAELRRKARFEALTADMEGQGWTAHNLTIGKGKTVYCDHPYELGLVAFERPAER